MKKITAFMLSLILLLPLFLVPAAAEENSALLSATLNENGTVTIAWPDWDQKGPYTIKFHQDTMGEMVDEWWELKSNIKVKAFTTDSFTPGEGFGIQVLNDNGDMIQTHFQYPLENFGEFKVKLERQLKIMPDKTKEDKIEKAVRFSAKDIEENIETARYGARLTVKYPQLKKDRNYLAFHVLRMPDGNFLQYTDAMRMDRQYREMCWRFYEFTPLFQVILDMYGYIPTGEYALEIYFDGKYVNEVTFHVDI